MACHGFIMMPVLNLRGELRFSSLEITFPEEFKKLRRQIEEEVNQRYQILKQMDDRKSVCDEP